MAQHPKPLEKMTKKELIRLCRKVYKGQWARSGGDLELLNFIGANSIPTQDGKPMLDPATTPPGRHVGGLIKSPWVPLTAAELDAEVKRWCAGYNKEVLPSVVALEKAVYGKDY